MPVLLQLSTAGQCQSGRQCQSGQGRVGGKAALSRFYSMAAPFDPTTRVVSALGRPASVKALLTC